MSEKMYKMYKVISILYITIINPILLRIIEDSEVRTGCVILTILFSIILLARKEDLVEDEKEK